MEKFAILFGSNLYINDSMILLQAEIDEKLKKIVEVREIYRARSPGSYLTVDCDIKDVDNEREIKLAKGKPVVVRDDIDVICDRQITHVTRKDGTTVIKVEQLSADNPTLPQSGPIGMTLKNQQFGAIIRVTGEFYAGVSKVFIDEQSLRVNRLSFSGNLRNGGGGTGLVLRSNSWSFG